ncbi:MAG: anhydro-N-acetylmuramic acid kinase [Nitrospinae bacterium]|nr:anhydro-N-acetylmuramic acid kinase [Nitrospinota bacterium]
MKTKKVIGLVSGTSADGVNAALVEIRGCGLETKVNLLAFEIYPFSNEIRKSIFRASNISTSTVDLISALNFYIGEIFANAAIDVAKKGDVKLSDLDLIGSHGQTIYHNPDPTNDPHYGIASTLQIGEPSIIAERTGVTTVADFRPRDMSAGGLGAPLSPYVHFLLFRDTYNTRVVHNIGGISNLTLIPCGGDMSEVIAFDTGPGNMVIDGITSIITDGEKGYDEDGILAKRGKIDKELLSSLMRHPFLIKTPPKTTGREEFGDLYIREVVKMGKDKGVYEDGLISTVTAFTAESILLNYRLFILPKYRPTEVIFCGGGTKNPVLMDMLRDGLRPIRISETDDYNIPSNAIEAVAFAVLANETVSGIPSNILSVTKAGRRVILGKIIPA